MNLVIERLPNGAKKLQTSLESGASTMVILETIFYAFTSYPKSSVFSCETHLTSRLYFSRQNSQGLWNLQGAKIRISTSLDTDLFSPNLDSLHSKIGATLTLMRNSNRDQYCDYCKLRYPSSRGELNALAKAPAYWKIISERPGGRSVIRFYCLRCADQVQNWSDGTFYSLKEQLDDSITKYQKGEYFNDKLA